MSDNTVFKRLAISKCKSRGVHPESKLYFGELPTFYTSLGKAYILPSDRDAVTAVDLFELELKQTYESVADGILRSDCSETSERK